MTKFNSKYIINLFLHLFAFWFVSQIEVKAQTPSDYAVIKEANKVYISGDFQKAVELYEKLVKSGYSATELYFNLGNSYYRIGDYKSAILNYERAKKLNPNDDNIQINLDFCQKFVVDKIEVVPKFFLINWMDSFLNWFSSKGWSLISIFTFVGFLGLALTFLFTKSLFFRKLGFYFGIISFFISCISFYAAYAQNQKLTSHDTGIIFSQSVSVKSAPNESGTVLFVIHEGLKVAITNRSEGWKEIKLADGKVGWLPNEAIVDI